jgi:predicted RNase H-like nuclease
VLAVPRLLGIDGCPFGWVSATFDASTAEVHFELHRDLATLLEEARLGAARLVVDIPIGLPSAGTRKCDVAARVLLGPRRSSVFPPPCRATLNETEYVDACRANASACGKKLSRQAFAILGKIRAVDALVEPALQDRVREAHPEVTFAGLAGASLTHPKKTAMGQRERLALLAREGLVFDPAGWRRQLDPKNVLEDDLVDAAACLVTARRVVSGDACCLPHGEVEWDARGLRMEIVA